MSPSLRSLAVVVTAIAVLMPASASAADEIGLSRDGTTFAPALEAPLFSSATRWVPGDVRTERFFVRNNTNAVATMDIDLRSESVGELIASGDVRLQVSVPGGRSTVVSEPGPVVTKAPVAAGGAVPVDVTVSFSAASTNMTQNLLSQLRFGVRLTDARGSIVGGDGVEADGSGAGGGSASSDGAADADGLRGRGALPNVGAALPLWSLLAGALCVAAGGFLARPRKSGVSRV